MKRNELAAKSDPERNRNFARGHELVCREAKPPARANERQPPAPLPTSRSQSQTTVKEFRAAGPTDSRMAESTGRRKKSFHCSSFNNSAPRHKRRPPSFKLVKIGRGCSTPEAAAMTAPLTRSRDAVYRSRVGAESVPMGLREGLTELRRPNRAASHSERGFSMAGRVDYPAKGSRFSVGPVLRGVRSPGHQGIREVSRWSVFYRLRSLAMLESRSCCRAPAERRAP